MYCEFGVYKIQNLINGKVYVGSCSAQTGVIWRWRNHIRELEAGTHCNKYLLRSWQKYGRGNFAFIFIEVTERGTCIEREQYWMEHYKSYLPENGYNNLATAGSPLGTKRSPEAIEKTAAALRGKPRPQHVLDAIRAATIGRKDTEEQRERKRQAQLGRKITWGDKISETKRGVSLSEHHKQALKDAAGKRKRRACVNLDTGETWANLKLAATHYNLTYKRLLNNIKKGTRFEGMPNLALV
jgi:group I intron endonuclease